MSEPKVPSWMRYVVPGPDAMFPGPPFYAADGGYSTYYYPREQAAYVDRMMTAQDLRELADLIDSCREEDGDE